ncbi:uncharacterized protein BXIN_0600 [Babesia sp. Xinjiang]|uniref:uncharacterized protein n=1 Tax=Babesia sp. Xinjiang TaxID=462227 RepID=UPI000A242F39|nr:uncharacterized protein BXIN_0600 [Babesia sp. Xinjiang]ORM41785.1 hypothetical protein BXIN_0600 [Babesia sp. Xinjiang]
MGRPPLSAAYFLRTTEVDEFLSEFARVRSWYITNVYNVERRKRNGDYELPYRRQPPKNGPNSDHNGETLNDSMLDAAKEMANGDSIHLDAFIRLVVAHNEVVDALDNKACDVVQPRRFELHEIMKNAKISDRKVPKHTEAMDSKSVLRAADEKRYQRLVADVNEKFRTSDVKVGKFKPPIIGGANAIFGVVLTFIGGYSIAGALGVKDNLKKAIIGTVFASAALLVDTLLFLMRGEW